MSTSTLPISPTSKAYHWSAIRDLRVAADITGAGSFGDVGPATDEILGSALGIPGATSHSGFGIFTDLNGNTICIATESRPAWGMIKGKQLLGKDPYTFHLERNMGTGGAYEANAFMIAGTGQRFGGYAGWIDNNDSERNVIPGLNLEKYSDFPGLLTQIENSGKKFDRPIVVLSSGEPVSLSSILTKAFTLILAAAKPFASLIGIPPVLFDLISGSLNTIITQGRFDIKVLADAAQLMIPQEYRGLITKATNVYAAIDSGNYMQAMQQIGVVGSIEGAKNSLLNGDITALIGKSKLTYNDLVATVQNVFQFDTIRSLAAANRSGTVLENVIDAGSMAKVPVLRNLLTTMTSGDTLSSAIPGVSEIMQTVVNETNDIVNPDLHKGAVHAALGLPVGADTFDDLTKRGVMERVSEVVEKGIKSFVMPIVIPEPKRYAWAQEVANEFKIQVLADSFGGKSILSQNSVQEWA